MSVSYGAEKYAGCSTTVHGSSSIGDVNMKKIKCHKHQKTPEAKTKSKLNGNCDDLMTRQNRILQSIAPDYSLKPSNEVGDLQQYKKHPGKIEKHSRKRKREERNVSKKKKRRNILDQCSSSLENGFDCGDHRTRKDTENPQSSHHEYNDDSYVVAKTLCMKNTAKVILHRKKSHKRTDLVKKHAREDRQIKRMHRHTSTDKPVSAEQNSSLPKKSGACAIIKRRSAKEGKSSPVDLDLPPSPVLMLSEITEKYLNEYSERNFIMNDGHDNKMKLPPSAGQANGEPHEIASEDMHTDWAHVSTSQPAKATTKNKTCSENIGTCFMINGIRSVSTEVVESGDSLSKICNHAAKRIRQCRHDTGAREPSSCPTEKDGEDQCCSTEDVPQKKGNLARHLLLYGECLGQVKQSSLDKNLVKYHDKKNKCMKRKSAKLRIKLNCKTEEERTKFKNTLTKVKGCVLVPMPASVNADKLEVCPNKISDGVKSGPESAQNRGEVISNDADMGAVSLYQCAKDLPERGGCSNLAHEAGPTETPNTSAPLNAPKSTATFKAEPEAGQAAVAQDEMPVGCPTEETVEVVSDRSPSCESDAGLPQISAVHSKKDFICKKKYDSRPHSLPRAVIVLNDISSLLTSNQKQLLSRSSEPLVPSCVTTLKQERDDEVISMSSDGSIMSPELRPPSPLRMDGCLSYLFNDSFDYCDPDRYGEKQTGNITPSRTGDLVETRKDEMIAGCKTTLTTSKCTVALEAPAKTLNPAGATNTAFLPALACGSGHIDQVIDSVNSELHVHNEHVPTLVTRNNFTEENPLSTSKATDCKHTSPNHDSRNSKTLLQRKKKRFERVKKIRPLKMQHVQELEGKSQDGGGTSGLSSAAAPHNIPTRKMLDLRLRNRQCKDTNNSNYSKRRLGDQTQLGPKPNTSGVIVNSREVTRRATSLKHVAMKKFKDYTEIVITVGSLRRRRKGEKSLRGEYNYLCAAALKDLIRALGQCSKDDRCKAVLLSSVGPIFCSGLNPVSLLDWNSSLRKFSDIAFLLRRLVNFLIMFRKPLVAAVQGPAVGLGASFLLFCDAVYASERANFHWPNTRLALTPFGCATVLLPQVVGRVVAHSVLLGGRVLTSQEAKTYGLVTEVFPHDSFNRNVLAHFQQWCSPLTSVMLETKRMLSSQEKQKLRDINNKECELLKECLASETNQTIIQKHIVADLLMH